MALVTDSSERKQRKREEKRIRKRRRKERDKRENKRENKTTKRKKRGEVRGLFDSLGDLVTLVTDSTTRLANTLAVHEAARVTVIPRKREGE